MQTCKGDRPTIEPTKTTTTHTRDTIHDTTIVVEIEYLEVVKWLPAPIPEPVVEELGFNLYKGTQNDSILNLSYEVTTKGELEGLQFNYSLNKPQTVEKIRTIETVDTVIVTKAYYRGGLFLKSSVGYSQLLDSPSFRVGANLTTKSRLNISYEYDIPQEMHCFGLGYRLTQHDF